MGLVEGEGCFNIGIGLHEPKCRRDVGKSFIKRPYIFSVKPSFHIALAVKDRAVLDKVQPTIGHGKVYINKRAHQGKGWSDVAHYYVMGIEGSLKVVDFFKDIQFETTKGEDFMLWCNCISLIQKAVHGTKEGIIEIARLRDCMNNTKQATKRSPEELGELFEEKLIERRQKWLTFIHNNYSKIYPKTINSWKLLLQDDTIDDYSKEVLKLAITGPKQAILA
ncbi:MAG: hypothetical protein HOC95_01045 [Candidatus Diapherotrites archaeon]|nr:hypothetical protein [Candidatus Diapherotrites archaeon]